MKNFSERQIEIMEAASLIISNQGIQNLTTKSLAEEIGLSEPALYRHFKNKNEILWSLLEYFKLNMQEQIQNLPVKSSDTASNRLRALFDMQLSNFAKKPAVVSVIFGESIFDFEEKLSAKALEITKLMQEHIQANIRQGQANSEYTTNVEVPTLCTIIIGSMRLTVQKWKNTDYKTDVVAKGKNVLEGILSLIENK